MQATLVRASVFFALLFLGIVHGQDIVLLGDSLSDNGNGYAGTVKFVLQTNDVSILFLKLMPGLILLLDGVLGVPRLPV